MNNTTLLMTIGYEELKLEDFLEKLKEYRVSFLVDVRLYRKLRDKGESKDNIIEKIKNKFGKEIIAHNRDIYFFVGSHSLYRESFMILGIFWPLKSIL